MKRLIYLGLACAALSACSKPALVCVSRETNEIVIAKWHLIGDTYHFTDSNGIDRELDGPESNRWECDAVTEGDQANVS